MTPRRLFTSKVPGTYLEVELQIRGWTQRDLAKKIGRPYQTINEIIKGRKRISAATAIQLGRVLGPSAEFWWNLECSYQLKKARIKNQWVRTHGVIRK